MLNEIILNQVNEYYTDKIIQHGPTPQGVDWNGEESQNLRFQVLSKVIENQNFSILDYGCGFGSLHNYLKQNRENFIYNGFDISSEMIEKAKAFKLTNTFFSSSITDFSPCDYVIASGIFNVRLQYNSKEWLDYILKVLNNINSFATKGFSFNMLTSYSDAIFMKDYLYYAEPEFFFKYCKENFSKNVALLHDYPLYEFSIIVKKYSNG